MSHTQTSGTIQRPAASGAKDRKYLLNRNVRQTVPLRKSLVQALPGSENRAGPLREFVVNGDVRGLNAYLIAVAATGSANEDGWSTTLDSLVWAR
ncbi:hypothetical protein [Actinomadura violacea]|uniref:Uncharacterized protein n=1 Tax=Actinomadura violacea TaxID=2819934 RepID=A0ABS3RN12_9ACTN|nr:hypothetical protein [Actinomadura violacea]MBO2458131.1 hypothetical protein [Actinomadura violacea]